MKLQSSAIWGGKNNKTATSHTILIWIGFIFKTRRKTWILDFYAFKQLVIFWAFDISFLKNSDSLIMYFLLENLALPSSIFSITLSRAHWWGCWAGLKCTGLLDLRFQDVSSPGHQKVGLCPSVETISSSLLGLVHSCTHLGMLVFHLLFCCFRAKLSTNHIYLFKSLQFCLCV